MSGFAGIGVVVSCEHASNRLPLGFALPAETQLAHVAWDPGAVEIARGLARYYRTELFAGRYSRLVVDLNRSTDHPLLIRHVSDGRQISFNRRLGAEARRLRVERYWRPYRESVAAAVGTVVVARGCCLHVTAHSFTPTLGGVQRGNDLGVLYDPRRQPEASIARRMRAVLAQRSGLVVWLNRPYRGTADGFLPALRRQHPQDAYIGIELEFNQRLFSERAAVPRLTRWTVEALDTAIASHFDSGSA